MAVPGNSDAGKGPSLFVSLRSFWSVVVAIFYTRLDLFTAELEDEGIRLVKFVASGLISLLCLHTAFFFAMLFLLAACWDSEGRLWVIGGIFAVYLLAGLSLLLYARRMIFNRPKFLSQTLAELRRDVEGLKQAAAAATKKEEEPS
jgi:uncharacterized membrane protein YqjE